MSRPLRRARRQAYPSGALHGALWYVLGTRRVQVRHLVVICLVTLSLFLMLWFGIVVADLSAAETTAASGLTVVLIGVGLVATTRGLRRPPQE